MLHRAHCNVLNLAIAVLGGACAQSADGADEAGRARLAALEQEVQKLTQTVSTMKILLDGLVLPPRPMTDGQDFSIECPQPWEELDAMHQTQWGCRVPQPLANGFWPNCNVTLAPTEPGTTARQYATAGLQGSPEMKSAKRISETPSTVGGQPAYEIIYEHDLTAIHLRVLGTVVVHDRTAYALTCTAPPDAFAAVTPTFRRIIQSFQLGAEPAPTN
jgi:hypothetical protein